MDKKIIVTKFFEKGKLLSPEALDILERNFSEDCLKADYSESVLSPKIFEKSDVTILKNLNEIMNEIKTEDFLNFYRSKYEKMKNIISSRLRKNFISINKTPGMQEFYIIGIVREITRKDEKMVVNIEDPTGNMEIIFDDIGDLDLDDVVGIMSVSHNKLNFGKHILYPDVPIRRPTCGKGKLCFISDLHLEEAPIGQFEKFLQVIESTGINFLFVAGDIGDMKKFEKMIGDYCHGITVIIIPGHGEYPHLAERTEMKNIITLSNPSIVDINNVKILVIHYADATMLKKRYMGKSKTILPEDYLVLDIVPDIIHSGHTHRPHVSNYKATTFVNAGSLLTKFMPVIIDLETRLPQQITL